MENTVQTEIKKRCMEATTQLMERGRAIVRSDRFNRAKEETMKRLENDSIKKGTSLLWLNVSVRLKSVLEYLKTVCSYYTCPNFRKADLSLTAMYLFHSPFAISKRFLVRKEAEEVYCYGETPPSTLELIARECRITEKEHLFELGCGRGRGALWFHTVKKCRVTAIEQVPEFVERADRIVKRLGLKGIDFKNENFLESDLSEATAVYLYGTSLDEAAIEALVKKLEGLKAGSKVITVSYPLTDYSGAFELMKRFPARFPWGETDIYLQLKK